MGIKYWLVRIPIKPANKIPQAYKKTNTGSQLAPNSELPHRDCIDISDRIAPSITVLYPDTVINFPNPIFCKRESHESNRSLEGKPSVGSPEAMTWCFARRFERTPPTNACATPKTPMAMSEIKTEWSAEAPIQQNMAAQSAGTTPQN